MLLRQPDLLVFQPHLNLHPPIFGWINEELPLGGEIGLFGRVHASRISATLLAIVASSSRDAALRVSSSSLSISSCSLNSSSLTASPGAMRTERPELKLQPWASISFGVA